ncbi:MAG TPA: hypothetical protein VFW07_08255 [Parafilimonas sp.]|nr:hypothetical protein [Parafilimonas sp.]
MLPTGYLILFFGLRASHRCGSIVASQHLYYRHKEQLQVRGCSYLIKLLAAFWCIFLFAQNSTAQIDSNYVDTISMKHIDTVAVSNRNEVSIGYDDQDDGYVDTTVKHIYDTSQYFFNWKDSINDLFIDKKINQRQLIDAEVNALKKEDDFWYIPAIEKLEARLKNDPKFRDSLLRVSNHQLMDEKEAGFLYQPWFNTLVWIIIIGIFAAAVIYFLAQNKINIFSREGISSTDAESDEEGEDIFHLSYTKLIQNAEKGKDYRNAIRLMFLQTLKLLSDTNAIHYQPDYTNFDYLQQLKPSKYHNEFFDVMHGYEYVWYGKFDISTEQYTALKNKFLKLQHKII